MEEKREDYSISTNQDVLDLNLIHNYLSKESYWAVGVPIEVVENSIKNSLCFGVYYKGCQVGFARLVTDKATIAYLADVFILPAHRGKGLSKWLIGFIQSHPALQGLRRWLLATKDAHGLYEQFGWSVLPEEGRHRFMQRHFFDVYKKSVE